MILSDNRRPVFGIMLWTAKLTWNLWGGGPMILFRAIACATVAALWLGIASAAQSAQTAPAPPASSGAAASTHAPQAESAPGAAAESPAPQIDTAEITRRANEEVGVDIQATTAGWQRELDRVDADSRRPRLRYAELNNLRSELQRIRSAISAFSGHVQVPLDAVKAQLDLLGPAPGAGQAREPEQIALSRAELNYHLGLLSGAQSAVNSSELRIDQLINAIQDLRRKNFTTYLFQPVPGV